MEQRWDDFLIAEHEMIERAMAVLKACLEDMDQTVKEPVQVKRALDFLLEFGDKMHNKKEEDELFPLMHARGIPESGGPLGVMLDEHRMERELLTEMGQQAMNLKGLSDDDLILFQQRGLEYLEIRAEHIWKENDVLYPMARQVLRPEDGEKLLAAFNTIDRETYGEQARQLFNNMVAEVEKGSAATKQRLINNLSHAQLDAIMEALPFEVTFVDAADTVAYFNRLDKEKLFPRTRSVIGRKVEKCHPAKSVDTVKAIVDGFKNRTRDKAEFWINFRGDTIMIRYFPVYSEADEYMGVLEVTQAVGWIKQLSGEKRLLD